MVVLTTYLEVGFVVLNFGKRSDREAITDPMDSHDTLLTRHVPDPREVVQRL